MISKKNAIAKWVFFALFLAILTPTFAQKKESAKARREREAKEKEKESRAESGEEEVSLKNRLWYGGGVNLGFNSFNGDNIFGFGVSPMVGYKIWGPFSAGPRFGIQYSGYKTQGFKALHMFNFDAGLFARAKFFDMIFLHGEVSNSWFQEPGYDGGTSLIKIKDSRVNQYLGIGYNGGSGSFGQDLYILYNIPVGNDPNAYQSPWEFRFGFTYKF